MNVENAVQLFVMVLEYCLPFIVVFGLGGHIVDVVCSAAFGGKVRL